MWRMANPPALKPATTSVVRLAGAEWVWADEAAAEEEWAAAARAGAAVRAVERQVGEERQEGSKPNAKCECGTG